METFLKHCTQKAEASGSRLTVCREGTLRHCFFAEGCCPWLDSLFGFFFFFFFFFCFLREARSRKPGLCGGCRLVLPPTPHSHWLLSLWGQEMPGVLGGHTPLLDKGYNFSAVSLLLPCTPQKSLPRHPHRPHCRPHRAAQKCYSSIFLRDFSWGLQFFVCMSN